MKPIRIANLPWRMIDGRAVIVQPSAGQVHELNTVAAFLWEKADGQNSLEQLAQGVCEEYQAELTQVMSDLQSFYAELEGQGLIRWES